MKISVNVHLDFRISVFMVYSRGVNSIIPTIAMSVMFAGQVPGKRPEIIYIASNSYWEELTITLPELPEYMNWSLKVNTIDSQTDLEYKHYTKEFKIAPRTVMVFCAQS